MSIWNLNFWQHLRHILIATFFISTRSLVRSQGRPAVQSSNIAILKRRRKIFCFKNPNHGKCKQSAMFSMSRNQISCGISSLAFPRKLSVHDTKGNCLSGCTRCKRCLGGILRKVFKVFDFEAIPKSPSENSAKSCWRESIITRSITMANRDFE